MSYGITKVPGVVPEVVAEQVTKAEEVTLTTKISEAINGLEKMRAVFAKRRHNEFGKQMPKWATGEEQYDILRTEDKTEQTIARTIKSLERMKDYAQAFDAMKPEAVAALITAAHDAAVVAAEQK